MYGGGSCKGKASRFSTLVYPCRLSDHNHTLNVAPYIVTNTFFIELISSILYTINVRFMYYTVSVFMQYTVESKVVGFAISNLL